MKKISCIVIDDESLARKIIINYLKAHEDIEIITECKNGFEGFKAINEHNPDLIFLDIQMPKINGFEMLELVETPPVVIFSTAFDHFALKAFEVNAVDYLLKPYSQDRFNDAVDKAKNKIKFEDKDNSAITKLMNHIDQGEEYLDRVVVKKKNEIIIVPTDDVTHITSDDDYVNIVTPTGKYLKQKRMKYYETKLDPNNFVRIHRSAIINLKHLKKIELYEKESHVVIMQDETTIPVSRTGYQKLKEILEN